MTTKTEKQAFLLAAQIESLESRNFWLEAASRGDCPPAMVEPCVAVSQGYDNIAQAFERMLAAVENGRA